MTQRISRERSVPKEGGFETRPYKPPDCALAQADIASGVEGARYHTLTPRTSLSHWSAKKREHSRRVIPALGRSRTPGIIAKCRPIHGPVLGAFGRAKCETVLCPSEPYCSGVGVCSARRAATDSSRRVINSKALVGRRYPLGRRSGGSRL
jgi:hypothetical protein